MEFMDCSQNYKHSSQLPLWALNLVWLVVLESFYLAWLVGSLFCVHWAEHRPTIVFLWYSVLSCFLWCVLQFSFWPSRKVTIFKLCALGTEQPWLSTEEKVWFCLILIHLWLWNNLSRHYYEKETLLWERRAPLRLLHTIIQVIINSCLIFALECQMNVD